MTVRTASVARTARTPDRLGAALAVGFIVLLVGSESALVLPDVGASASTVASFYAAHRGLAIVLQLVGLLAAAMLGGYAWRLRSVDRVVGQAGMVAAVCALAPTLITLVLAVLADPDHADAAGTWNALIPTGDDLLFVGIVVFSAGVAWRLRRRLPALAVLAALVSLACLVRLVLEAVGRPRSALESVGPLSFVVLVAVMAVLSFLGLLRRSPTAGPAGGALRPPDA
jgi:amino acid transporter